MTLKEALEVLDAGDADGVALVLAAEGIVGRIDSPCYCPVANFIRVACVQATTVMTQVAYLDGFVREQLPESVSVFIRWFDCGEYPELVAA